MIDNLGWFSWEVWVFFAVYFFWAWVLGEVLYWMSKDEDNV